MRGQGKAAGWKTTALLTVLSITFASRALAEKSPSELAIAGIKLGMTQEEVAQAIHDFDPDLTTETIRPPILPGMAFSRYLLIAQRQSRMLSDDIILVVFTAYGVKAAEIVRIKYYGNRSSNRERIIPETADAALAAAYGVNMEARKEPDGVRHIGSLAYTNEGALTKDRGCSLVTQSAVLPSDNHTLTREQKERIPDIRLWKYGPTVVPDNGACGITLLVEAFFGQDGFGRFIRQHLQDQSAAISDHRKVNAAQDAYHKQRLDDARRAGAVPPRL